MTCSTCDEINAFVNNNDCVITSHKASMSDLLEIFPDEIVCTPTLC